MNLLGNGGGRQNSALIQLGSSPTTKTHTFSFYIFSGIEQPYFPLLTRGRSSLYSLVVAGIFL